MEIRRLKKEEASEVKRLCESVHWPYSLEDVERLYRPSNPAAGFAPGSMTNMQARQWAWALGCPVVLGIINRLAEEERM